MFEQTESSVGGLLGHTIESHDLPWQGLHTGTSGTWCSMSRDTVRRSRERLWRLCCELRSWNACEVDPSPSVATDTNEIRRWRPWVFVILYTFIYLCYLYIKLNLHSHDLRVPVGSLSRFKLCLPQCNVPGVLNCMSGHLSGFPSLYWRYLCITMKIISIDRTQR